MTKNTDTQAIIKEWEKEQRKINMMKHAFAYIRKKWTIVPLFWVEFPGVCSCPDKEKCPWPGKHPIPHDAYQKPVTTGIMVEYWWTKFPLANIGILTGERSRVVVVDIDIGHGKEGWKSFQNIKAKYGQPAITPVSITGSGGRHLFYKWPGTKVKTDTSIVKDIDIRGDGGMIVLPPSMHSVGARYQWHKNAHPAKVPLKPLPEWVYDLFEIKRIKNQQFKKKFKRAKYRNGIVSVESLPMIEDGNRNNTLTSIVGRLCYEKREASEIICLMKKINNRCCNPPLEDRELDRLVTSAIKHWL